MNFALVNCAEKYGFIQKVGKNTMFIEKVVINDWV